MEFIGSDNNAGAVLVTERLGVRKHENTTKYCQPPWKRDLDSQIKGWRKDLLRVSDSSRVGSLTCAYFCMF